MEMIKQATKECGCEVIEYRCSGTECCEEAKSYGIRAVPSIAIDGKLVIEGKPSLDQLKKYIQ
jgi:predicted DsbA family dithiol-disulfide isomerase